MSLASIKSHFPCFTREAKYGVNIWIPYIALKRADMYSQCDNIDQLQNKANH